MGLGVFVAGNALEGDPQLFAHIGPGQVQDVVELHFLADQHPCGQVHAPVIDFAHGGLA
ncbi:hypothetical protein D3C84_1286630 [compost metagenome]